MQFPFALTVIQKYILLIINILEEEKYHPNELKKHKEQWLLICETLKYSQRISYSDGDSFSGLLSEIEFNTLIV